LRRPVRIEEIDAYGDGSRPALLDASNDSACRCLVPSIGDRHRPTILSQPARHGGADAARASGNDRASAPAFVPLLGSHDALPVLPAQVDGYEYFEDGANFV
jgi:hypothetical protein